MKESKWLSLLTDGTVKRWYENVAQGSPLTAEIRIRMLYRYLQLNELTPNQLVENAQKDRKGVEDQLQDFLMKQLKDGLAPSYVKNYIKAIKSWLSFNDVYLLRKIKVGNAESTPTIEDEQIPTKEELKTLLMCADARTKVTISFMAFAGLRPQVFGNYSGTDGLRIKNLPEIKIEGKSVQFKKTPTLVQVPAHLSKARHKYFTFLGREGMEYLKSYLETRLAHGEELTPETPVIITSPGFEKMGKVTQSENYGSKFIAAQNISKGIRDAMRPRFLWRPYVLRAYFDTQLLIAESNGKIPHAYRQFFMGHKGDIEARYTTNKGRLPPNLVEDMRIAYTNSEFFLSTVEQTPADTKETLLQMWREQARMYGIDPLKIRIEKTQDKTKLDKDEEIKILQMEIVKRTAPQLAKPGSTYVNNNGFIHKTITEKQLVKHLNEGWELVKELANGKMLVRKEPTS